MTTMQGAKMWCGSKMSKPLRYQSFTSIDPLFLRIDMLLKQVETPWHSTEWHSRRDIGCPCQPFASFPEGCAPISAMGSGGSVVSAAEKATTEEVREAFAALGPGEQKKAPGGRDPHGTLGGFCKEVSEKYRKIQVSDPNSVVICRFLPQRYDGRTLEGG